MESDLESYHYVFLTFFFRNLNFESVYYLIMNTNQREKCCYSSCEIVQWVTIINDILLGFLLLIDCTITSDCTVIKTTYIYS